MSNNLYNNDYTSLNNTYSITVSNLDVYGNINQDTGNKSNLDQVNCNDIIVNNTINTIPVSNICNTTANNNFTGSLNTFNSIYCNTNINNSPATYFTGVTSNLQQQLNTIKTTSGIIISGQNATVAVGSTTTLSGGSNATVTNSGTNLDAVFNFGIPRGITPTLSIGSVTNGTSPSVTIDNTSLSNPILNFTLVKGTDGITPTFLINSTVENIASGGTPYVTMTSDPTNSNIKTFKFGLVRGVDGTKGDKGNDGEKGTKGDKGDNGADGIGTAAGIASLVLSSVGFALSIGAILSLYAEQLGMGAVVAGTEAAATGGQSLLATRVKALENKTIDMYYDEGTSLNPMYPRSDAYFQFKREVKVSNMFGSNTILLDPDNESLFPNDLTCNGTVKAGYYLKSNYLEVGNNTNTFLKIGGTGFNIGFTNLNADTTTNIRSTKINIGCSPVPSTINIGCGDTLSSSTAANIINIGNAAAQVNIYGNIKQNGKQERDKTRPDTQTPFIKVKKIG